MSPKGLQSVFLAVFVLVVFCIICISGSRLRPIHHRSHRLTRRSHPSEQDHFPQPDHNHEHHRETMHVQGHPFNPRGIPTRHRGLIFHSPFNLETAQEPEEEEVKKALKEEGLTRVIYDEEEFITDEDYYDLPEEALSEEATFSKTPVRITEVDESFEEKNIKNLPSEKKDNEEFPKKFHPTHQKGKLKPVKEETPVVVVEEENFSETENEENVDMNYETTTVTESYFDSVEEDGTTEPSKILSYDTDKRNPTKNRNPFVLPVTTEGKATPKQKTEDPLKVYGFPKELLPIMPGGGSRFEDVEREKLERKKLSQTKGTDDDSAENGSSHEAEGLYSSASLSSISLCFYWLMSFHHFDRLLLL